eukprot:748112-Hanusia_phi.AAC.9
MLPLSFALASSLSPLFASCTHPPQIGGSSSSREEHVLAGLAASARTFLEGVERGEAPLFPRLTRAFVSSCSMLKTVTAENSRESPPPPPPLRA